MLRLLFGLLVLAACSVFVLDVGGARRPMFDTYIGVVEWALEDVVEDVQDSVAPASSPSPPDSTGAVSHTRTSADS